MRALFSLLLCVSLASARTFQIDVRNRGDVAYRLTNLDLGLTGADNQEIRNVFPGDVLEFQIRASGHPFAIHRNLGQTSVNDRYNSGVVPSAQAVDDGTLTFTIPNDVPDVLYYQCELHSAQSAAIRIGLAPATPSGVVSVRPTIQTGNPFSAPCCTAIYHASADLFVTRTALNVSSAGTSGKCGTLLPGWFAFSGLSYVSGTCYVGDLTAYTAASGVVSLGRGRVNWNPTSMKIATATLGNSETAECQFESQTSLGCSGTGSSFQQPIAGCFGTGCPATCGPCNTDTTPTTTAPAGNAASNAAASLFALLMCMILYVAI